MSDDAETFMWAVQTGDLDGESGVKQFVEKGFDVNYKAPGVRGATPIMTAADYGHAKMIEYLVSKGAKVNDKDNFGNTPLLNAVYEGHAEAVQVLVKLGADKSAKGPDGKTALEAAEKDEIKTMLK